MTFEANASRITEQLWLGNASAATGRQTTPTPSITTASGSWLEFLGLCSPAGGAQGAGHHPCAHPRHDRWLQPPPLRRGARPLGSLVLCPPVCCLLRQRHEVAY